MHVSFNIFYALGGSFRVQFILADVLTKVDSLAAGVRTYLKVKKKKKLALGSLSWVLIFFFFFQ